MDYEESLQYILNFPRLKKDPSLREIKALLAELDHPEEKLRAIHVAGTNGKGSTVTFLANILSEAGYKTGRYISPFVLEFRERMSIDGKMIGRKRLAKIMSTVREKVELLEEQGMVLNAFEVTTAVAFLWFAEENCDFVVLETGLGGRLDATNTVPAPILHIITAIGLDHTEILGDTIEKITAEKCGILREDCTLLTPPDQDPRAKQVMVKACMEKNATFVTGCADSGKLVSFGVEGMELRVGKMELSIPLVGRYQISNVLTVLSAVEILREQHIEIKDEHVVEGIANTKFPARFELCSKKPIVILDGAHNPQAANALAQNVEELLPEKRILLCGWMADKDYRTVASVLAPHFQKIVTVPVGNSRALSPEDLAEVMRSYCADVTAKNSAKEALSEVLENLAEDEALVVAGSFYLASELRPLLMRYKGKE